MVTNPCVICDRLNDWRQGKSPHFIHEFKHSIFVVGDHQFHRGYCLLLLKDHVRELHDLPADVQQGLFAELMTAAQAVHQAFEPWKLNYSCYGNQVEHIHWHIFPRYQTDPDHRSHPWLHSGDFAAHKIDANTARELAALISRQLKSGRPEA